MNQTRYTYQAGHSRRKKKGREDGLPSFLRFRIRLFLCFILFISFLFADRTLLKNKEAKEVFQLIGEQGNSSRWKETLNKERIEKGITDLFSGNIKEK
ncbi:MAG: hypothetical protein MR867_06700 [Eubacterium sp.]|nr:hypothetical protein [Eubacterium sp.]MDD7208732.1 hypothetical protein [Lachnospiraceae bacterium]MDY5497759.1 hypothetical protein [Anaerobutyricum sp.]